MTIIDLALPLAEEAGTPGMSPLQQLLIAVIVLTAVVAVAAVAIVWALLRRPKTNQAGLRRDLADRAG